MADFMNGGKKKATAQAVGQRSALADKFHDDKYMQKYG